MRDGALSGPIGTFLVIFGRRCTLYSKLSASYGKAGARFHRTFDSGNMGNRSKYYSSESKLDLGNTYITKRI